MLKQVLHTLITLPDIVYMLQQVLNTLTALPDIVYICIYIQDKSMRWEQVKKKRTANKNLLTGLVKI